MPGVLARGYSWYPGIHLPHPSIPCDKDLSLATWYAFPLHHGCAGFIQSLTHSLRKTAAYFESPAQMRNIPNPINSAVMGTGNGVPA